MPPIVQQILSLIQLAATAGPQLQTTWANARQLFAMLFAGGIITSQQQAALNSWAEQHEAATLAGEVPPEFQVEPDPE